MERTVNCAKIQLRRYIKPTFIFTAIYFVFFILIMFIIKISITTGSVKPEGQTNMSFPFVASIFLFFTIGAIFKNLFNNLLLLSNTRKTIFQSQVSAGVIFSAIMVLLCEIANLLTIGICKVTGLPMPQSYLGMIYKGINEPQKLLWVFSAFLLVIMFTYIYGIFGYRMGGKFRVIFWGGIGLLFMLVSLICAIKPVADALLSFIKGFIGYNTSNGFYFCSLYMLIIAAILAALLWAVMRRQPQRD